MNERLRILHADTDDLDNPLAGGQPVRTFAVNSRLAARHDITVLTATYRHACRRLSREGVHYRRLGFRLPFFGLSPHLSYMAWLGPAVSRLPHDLVVEEFTPPVGFNGLPWWTKSPVVLTVQWFFFEQWERRYRLPFTRWMKRIAQSDRYRYVIVQSREMERRFAELLPRAVIRRIPCGIADDAFLPGEPTSPKDDYVLYLGRLDMDHKGLDLLVQAWRQVCGARGIPLVLAGDGPALPKLRLLVEEAGIGHLVRFIGRVAGPAKRRAITGCRFLVMPSRYETFGIAAVEGMAAGKPIVCFDIAHLNEVVDPSCCRLIPRYDTEAFGHAVAELWASPAQCAAHGEEARRLARAYHWDAIARKQEDFYLEAYHSHHA